MSVTLGKITTRSASLKGTDINKLFDAYSVGSGYELLPRVSP